MRKDVRVLVDERQEFTFDLVGDEPMAADAARQWLDEQFTQMDCEPLRATGKLLLADKVLATAWPSGRTPLSTSPFRHDAQRRNRCESVSTTRSWWTDPP